MVSESFASLFGWVVQLKRTIRIEAMLPLLHLRHIALFLVPSEAPVFLEFSKDLPITFNVFCLLGVYAAGGVSSRTQFGGWFLPVAHEGFVPGSIRTRFW